MESEFINTRVVKLSLKPHFHGNEFGEVKHSTYQLVLLRSLRMVENLQLTDFW